MGATGELALLKAVFRPDLCWIIHNLFLYYTIFFYYTQYLLLFDSKSSFKRRSPAKPFGYPPFFDHKSATNHPSHIIAIYLTSIIKPSFYYPCVAVGKILAVAGFLDCQILQIETPKKPFFGRRPC